jgi:hypothetical protein
MMVRTGFMEEAYEEHMGQNIKLNNQERAYSTPGFLKSFKR